MFRDEPVWVGSVARVVGYAGIAAYTVGDACSTLFSKEAWQIKRIK